MRLILLTAISLSLVPNMAVAQTWQEWVKQNPTYPSMEKPAPAPAASPSAPTASPTAPASSTSAPPDLTGTDFSSFFPDITSTQDPAFASLFVQGCTYQGGPRGYCECVLTQMQNNFTFQELTALSDSMRANGEISEKFINSILPCVARY